MAARSKTSDFMNFTPSERRERRITICLLCFLCSLLLNSQAVPFAFWKTTTVSQSAPVGNPTYFFDAGAGFTTTLGVVTSWTDQQSGLVLMPQFTGPSSGFLLDGNPLLSFSDSGFGNCLTNYSVPENAPFLVQVVVQTGSDVLNGSPFCIFGDSGTARGIFISANQWELSWNSFTTAGSPAAGTPYVISALFGGDGQNSTLWVNGSVVLTQTGQTIGSITGFNLGGFGSAYPWSGYIGDFIYFATPPSDAQRQANEAWLRGKYGF